MAKPTIKQKIFCTLVTTYCPERKKKFCLVIGSAILEKTGSEWDIIFPKNCTTKCQTLYIHVEKEEILSLKDYFVKSTLTSFRKTFVSRNFCQKSVRLLQCAALCDHRLGKINYRIVRNICQILDFTIKDQDGSISCLNSFFGKKYDLIGKSTT